MKNHLFKNFQLQETDNSVLIEFSPEVMDFMSYGNIIPQQNGVSTYYFMPFVFQRFGNDNCFSVHRLSEVNLDDIGLNMYKKLTKEEFKEKYPTYEQDKDT